MAGIASFLDDVVGRIAGGAIDSGVAQREITEMAASSVNNPAAGSAAARTLDEAYAANEAFNTATAGRMFADLSDGSMKATEMTTAQAGLLGGALRGGATTPGMKRYLDEAYKTNEGLAGAATRSVSLNDAVVRKHMNKVYDGKLNSLRDVVSSGRNFSEDDIALLGKDLRINEGVQQQFAGMLQGGQRNIDQIMEFAGNRRGDFIDSAGTWDRAVAHRVPQKGAALTTTAFLVSNMSANRGQQSNAQLYGQQKPYG